MSDLLDLAVTRGDSQSRPFDDSLENRKSLVLSTALSFFFGPFGWFHAGAWREAIPASLAYLLLCYVLQVLPAMLLGPLMVGVGFMCALVGLGYALRFNRVGKRSELLKRESATS